MVGRILGRMFRTQECVRHRATEDLEEASFEGYHASKGGIRRAATNVSRCHALLMEW